MLFDQYTPTREQLQDSGDDLVQDCVNRLVARRRRLDEDRLGFCVPVHAAEHQAMQTDVQVGGR